MKTSPFSIMSAAGIACIATLAHAQPANDNCANAIPVANHSVTPFNTTGTTRDAVLSCTDPEDDLRDMWYLYNATAGERITASLCGSSTRPKAITAFWGGCGGTELACRASGSCGSGQPQITFTAPDTGAVLICVTDQGYPGSQAGVLNLDAFPPGPPANDTCAAAQIIPALGYYGFDTTFATTDGPSGGCNFNNAPDTHDIFFKYTAAADGFITADTLLSNATVDTTLQIFDACGGSVLACNDDSLGFGHRSRTCPLWVTTGQSITIRVASWGAGSSGFPGLLRLASSSPPPPSYVSPTNAILEPGSACDEYVDDVNYGCNPRVSPPEPRFTVANLCETYKGHAGYRTVPIPSGQIIHDFDSYRFTLPAADTVTFTGQTQFNATTSVFIGDYCVTQNFAYYGGVSTIDASCGAGSFTFSLQLPAGQYSFGIGNSADYRATCGSDYTEYWFRITGSTPCPDPVACVADLGVQGGLPGHDGILDNNDFVIFIDYFFNANPAADFGVQGGLPGHDGLFDNNDFIVFIDAFFDGCP